VAGEQQLGAGGQRAVVLVCDREEWGRGAHDGLDDERRK